jgi:hypothetical protein
MRIPCVVRVFRESPSREQMFYRQFSVLFVTDWQIQNVGGLNYR